MEEKAEKELQNDFKRIIKKASKEIISKQERIKQEEEDIKKKEAKDKIREEQVEEASQKLVENEQTDFEKV
jgi:hypothetical protein